MEVRVGAKGYWSEQPKPSPVHCTGGTAQINGPRNYVSGTILQFTADGLSPSLVFS